MRAAVVEVAVVAGGSSQCLHDIRYSVGQARTMELEITMSRTRSSNNVVLLSLFL